MDPAIALDRRLKLSIVVLDSLGTTRRLSGTYSAAQATTNLCYALKDSRVVGWDLSVSDGPREPRYV